MEGMTSLTLLQEKVAFPMTTSEPSLRVKEKHWWVDKGHLLMGVITSTFYWKVGVGGGGGGGSLPRVTLWF